ncbi:hypothetical protein F0919_09230 [Taibaiella lutea]|uniref:Uncharacterized protein n=1 Tax=Taibaiella lutea TaxID=2608001 RepID=A0A5M6CK20_9BACT|nr:hypothetical protein [Taibaiella lutea]KAA5534780.1 hypothetical protein F0919_09230 [Taibaiella lutea]
MRKKLWCAAVIGGIVALSLAGCKKRNTAEPGETPATAKLMSGGGTAANDGPTVLGNKLINPYTVANMEQGKRSLAAKGIHPQQTFTVKETHLYVKFKPANEDEYNELMSDNSLDLVDFPLDYDIQVVGNGYREPGLDESTPTPQYATLPSGFRFNENINFEILDRLYLPELDPELEDDYTYIQQLLYETYGMNAPNDRFTRFKRVDDQLMDSGGGGSDGFVQVFDTRLNRMVPLKGADILTLNGMAFYHGTTDNNGEYWLDNWYSGNAIVLVKMRKNDFTIRKNFFDNAYVARQANGTYCDIDIQSGMERMFATMFRAAYRYNYGDVGGLQRPTRPVFKQILVGADAIATGGSGINNIAWPKLKVWRYHNNGSECGTDEIFSTTIHELAHTAHVKTMDLGSIDYVYLTDQIRESWCVAVEWFVTGMEYKENGLVATSPGAFDGYGERKYDPSNPPQYPNRFAYQYWNANLGNDYTSLFINLIDDFNENGVWFPNVALFGQVNDQVSGYTLQSIESSILKFVARTHPSGGPYPNSLSELLKINKPNGVTDAQIDLLLSSY